jgi:hypothetical protein
VDGWHSFTTNGVSRFSDIVMNRQQDLRDRLFLVPIAVVAVRSAISRLISDSQSIRQLTHSEKAFHTEVAKITKIKELTSLISKRFSGFLGRQSAIVAAGDKRGNRSRH